MELRLVLNVAFAVFLGVSASVLVFNAGKSSEQVLTTCGRSGR